MLRAGTGTARDRGRSFCACVCWAFWPATLALLGRSGGQASRIGSKFGATTVPCRRVMQESGQCFQHQHLRDSIGLHFGRLMRIPHFIGSMPRTEWNVNAIDCGMSFVKNWEGDGAALLMIPMVNCAPRENSSCDYVTSADVCGIREIITAF